jgi:hypothetical protein
LAAHACVLSHPGGHGLVQVRKRPFGEVDEFVLDSVPLRGVVENPLGDGLAVAAGARAADDDRDLGHAEVSFN